MKIKQLLQLTALYSFVAACGPKQEQEGSSTTNTSSTEVVNVPQSINYQLINVYPHDSSCFAEGLQFADGFLYESAGMYGHSDIRKVDLKTGKVVKQVALDRQYFGEGISVLGNKIYQLTYREGTGFVYDKQTLKQLEKFSYTTGEGWGMTNDGRNLIYSDGTNTLYFMDPCTRQVVKKISVTDEHGLVNNINELELIKGSIYANQWQTDLILKIDTATGKVLARADLGDLRAKVGISPLNPTNERAPEVLNGIAYDSAGNRIFVTGKYWPKLLEIKLDN